MLTLHHAKLKNPANTLGIPLFRNALRRMSDPHLF